jgi:hypothetical protein
MAETARARSWLWQTITGDTQVAAAIGNRLYLGNGPVGAAYPFGVLQLLSGTDLMGVGPARIWVDMLWLVKIIAKGTSTAPIEPVVDRIDALLHAKSGTVAGGVIVECHRERPFELPTVEGGVSYVQLGAEWRLKAQAA